MILITRPHKKSQSLAKKIKSGDYHIDALLSFLIRNKKTELNQYTDYIVGSSQSVLSLQNKSLSEIKRLKKSNFYVIGEEVAKDLRCLGFFKIKKIFRNSYDLIQYLKKINTGRKLFCYFSGSTKNIQLIENLNKHRIKYKREILYTVKPKKNFGKRTIKYFNDKKITIVLLFSSHTAQLYVDLLKRTKLEHRALNVLHLCLSKNIANVIKKQGYKKVYYSKYPTEKSLMELLSRLV